MVLLRDRFWRLAHAVFHFSFNHTAAATLCSFSFDQRDPGLSVETLSFLIQVLRRRDPTFLQMLTAQRLTFETFFPLLISQDPFVRAQCLHIFVLCQALGPDGEALMRPYGQDGWIAAIVSTIYVEKTPPILADIVFGYMFGFYKLREDSLVPPIRISQLDRITTGFRFQMLSLLPLAMLLIADFEDVLCKQYLMAIDRTVSLEVPAVLEKKDWDHPFALFLMHRVPSLDCPMDKSAIVCLHTLTCLYGIAAQQGQPAITQLPLFINLCSSRANRDYSHILSHILSYFYDQFVFNPRARAFPDDVLASITKTVFEYLFFLNDACAFYVPAFGDVVIETPIGFQRLHTIKWIGIAPTVQFVHATRTGVAGMWHDADLAVRLLRILTRAPESPEVFAMSGRVLAVGLRHVAQCERFLPFLSILRTHKWSRDGHDLDALMNILAGLITSCFASVPPHPCFQALLQELEGCWTLLTQRITVRESRPTTVDMLLRQFPRCRHNLLHTIVEQGAVIESGMGRECAQFQRDNNRQLAELAENNHQVASHFATLNATKSSHDLSARDKQIHVQLHQFAAHVRNSHREGRKAYRKLWRTLSSDDGPWYEATTEIHWWLDPTELSCGRRGRLLTNYKFKDHKDASSRRDNGCIDAGRDSYADHVKETRISEFKGDQAVIAIRDDADDVDEANDETDQGIVLHGDNIILKVDANLVTIKRVHPGVLIVTKAYLIFQGMKSSKHRRIDLTTIRSILLRHYLLTDTSFEVFTTNHRSYFVDFVDESQRRTVLTELKGMALPNCTFLQMEASDIEPLLNKANQQWMDGSLSNFDYLMKVNRLAGRTYNDLGQYPVFPWVIANYDSETLNLDDPATFRDLATPIGALNEERLSMMKERMDSAYDEDQKCLYHALYLSQAVIVGYLIRMEPFTSLHIELQSGRFDASARLFNSIAKAWESVTRIPMDYRELIPEFFYFPDFLINSNGFDLGADVNDVELPRWASSARDFISKHRAALECPYVTAMLPRWIDMIFGVTSRGPDAIPIDNVFAPSFFPETLTESVRRDSSRYSFLRGYAACFGQAPVQLFTDPHKSRRIAVPVLPNWSAQVTELYDCHKPIISLELRAGAAVLINSCFELTTYNLLSKESSVHHLFLQAAITDSVLPMMRSLVQTSHGFALTGAPWDTAFTLSNARGLPLHIKRAHSQRLSAVAISRRFYATAAFDCTVMLWRMQPNRRQVPHATIAKHRSAVHRIALCDRADACVSCSRNGEIVSVALSSGAFIRKVQCDIGDPTDVAIWPDGTSAVAFTASNRSVIVVLDQNLAEVAREVLPATVKASAAFEWPNGKNYMAVGMADRRIAILALPECEEVWKIEQIDWDVARIAVAKKPMVIVIGTTCGKVIAVPFEGAKGAE
jgi:hypothetical protein